MMHADAQGRFDHGQTIDNSASPGARSPAAGVIGRGHEREPLLHYAALMTTFATLTSTTVIALRVLGVPFPQRLPLRDLALLGLATSRLSQLVTRDKVTRAVRAPFTEVVPGASADEVKERPRPLGDKRRAIGELVLCPRCVGMWAAMGLSCGYMISPGWTRLVAGMLATARISDFVNARLAAR